MKLIKFEDYTIKIADEALLIKPIRKLFNKDRTATKEKFLQQISILYFMVDPCSTYTYIIDEEERLKEILKQEGLGNDYVISEDLKEAMDVYRKHTETSASLLLKDTRITIDKVRKYLISLDLTETDDKGKPKYQINAITSAIKQIPELAKSLVEAEQAVQKEQQDESRVRGGAEKSIWEDGIKFS